MFEGYNVIQLVLEGFSGYAIDPELTPTLYKLTHEGFIFNNYYTALHYTSTSNGECQTLLGLYPKNGNPITMKDTDEGLVQLAHRLQLLEQQLQGPVHLYGGGHVVLGGLAVGQSPDNIPVGGHHPVIGVGHVAADGA